MVREIYYEVHMTRFLHTVRISNVDNVMFVNSIGKMVSFERGKETEKGVPVLSRPWDKEKILSEESNLKL